MHGWSDDVVGRVIAQLHNELAEIGFPDLNTSLLQYRTEVDFFRHHGFRLHHGAHTEPRGNVLYVGAGFLAIGRPENMSTARNHFFFELKKVAIQMIDGAKARTHFQRANGTSKLVPFPFKGLIGTTEVVPFPQPARIRVFPQSRDISAAVTELIDRRTWRRYIRYI